MVTNISRFAVGRGVVKSTTELPQGCELCGGIFKEEKVLFIAEIPRLALFNSEMGVVSYGIEPDGAS
jgi:hypothetical protein